MKVEYCSKCNNITNISLSKEDASYVINGDSSDWCSCDGGKQSSRDTQFAGFAHLVLMELVDKHSFVLDWDKSFVEIEDIIARRAYDLVWHTVFKMDCLDAFEHNAYKEMHGYTVEEMIVPIPDMTEWPDEEEQ